MGSHEQHIYASSKVSDASKNPFTSSKMNAHSVDDLKITRLNMISTLVWKYCMHIMQLSLKYLNHSPIRMFLLDGKDKWNCSEFCTRYCWCSTCKHKTSLGLQQHGHLCKPRQHVQPHTTGTERKQKRLHRNNHYIQGVALAFKVRGPSSSTVSAFLVLWTVHPL